jgi:GNAT superfamily N-acetyltransferase
MEIRPVRQGEALTVARVHVQADGETYRPLFGRSFHEVALADSLARWEQALAQGDVFLAATDAGRLVGLAHASGAWMSALYLLASHRRRGIGAQLLAALCEARRLGGVGEIGFGCVSTNADAITFYEALGGRQVGRQRMGEGQDVWEDVIFTLATDAPAAFRRG